MFTVKHQFYPAGLLVENLYEAERVTYCDTSAAKGGVIGGLELRNGESFIAGLWGGVAYVTNENGATVAIYHLPEPELPRSYSSPIVDTDLADATALNYRSDLAEEADPNDYPPDDPDAVQRDPRDVLRDPPEAA